MQITKEEYQLFKPLLFSIGYRLLGSVAEAEDMVQETFLKFHLLKEENIRIKKAYLCKIMTNLCLDALKVCQAQTGTVCGTMESRAAAA